MGNHVVGLKGARIGSGTLGQNQRIEKKADLCNVINNRFVLILFSRVQRVQRRVTLAP